MTHSSGETNRLIQDISELENKITELENRLKEKETYHADCLRIKELEQQLALTKKRLAYLSPQIYAKVFAEEFESGQNDKVL